MNLRVEEILNYTSDAILSVDRDLNIVLFNPAAEGLFGYAEEEILGQPLEILLPTRFRGGHPQHLENFNASPDTARRMSNRDHVRGLTKSGVEISMDISIQKHPDSSSASFTAICRNVTAEVEFDRVLKTSEARLSRAQAIAHLGNWEWEISTGELTWSDEIFRIFGMPPQEVAPSFEAFLEIIHPEDRTRVSDAVNDSVENDAPYQITHRVLCSDGTEKVVREVGEVLRDADGKAFRMDGTVQDITESWHIGEELRKVGRAAQAADRTKSQFMSIMSHELRTPMNAIMGSASLLDLKTRSDANSEYQEYVRHIQEGGKQLLSLIDDVLQFADLKSEDSTCNRSYFEASSLIEETLRLTQAEANRKSIAIVPNIAEGLPALYLDPLQCRQILLNLLSNAIKFSEQGSTVVVGVEQQDHEMVLSVIDQGIGMSQDEIKSIFNPFEQGNMELSRPYPGIGLGLSVTQTLTDLHGGRIEVHSTPGEGSIFQIHFPLPDEEASKERA